MTGACDRNIDTATLLRKRQSRDPMTGPMERIWGRWRVWRSALCLYACLVQASAFLVSTACRSLPQPGALPADRARACNGQTPAAWGSAGCCARQTRSPALLATMSGAGATSWELMVDRVIDDLNKGMAKYIFVRNVDPETAAELRAAVIVAGRGYKRRSAPPEGAPTPTLQEVVTAVHSIVKDAVVEREELVPEDEWDKIALGFGQASAVVNDEGEERPANAPPLSLDEVVIQLERLFPNASPAEREEAARRGLTLEAATDLIMTSAISLERMSAKSAVARRGRKPAPEPVPPGGDGVFLTKGVNGGASAFGLYFDVSAKDYPIRITEIRACASAGRSSSPDWRRRPTGSGSMRWSREPDGWCPACGPRRGRAGWASARHCPTACR